MKLIALRDFRNNDPKLIIVRDPIHPGHVHKGARLEIDESTDEGKELIAILNKTGSVGDATDKKTCEAVDAEAAAENKRLEGKPA